MEESLEPNTEVIKEISDKSNKPDSEGIKESITEKVTNTDENIPYSQNISAPKNDIKKENEKSEDQKDFKMDTSFLDID